MKKIVVYAVALMLISSLAFAQQKKKLFNETVAEKAKRMEWWNHDRFGMFIHWGLYSMGARHEWQKTKEKTPESEYQLYFDNFNPDMYNPRDWAKRAKAAGMKYVVLTTKHHEGFCLFDSKYTDYKATNTQARRDLVKEFVDALRAEGLRVGFYYSIIDWHHPDFKIDLRHPLRPEKYKNVPKANTSWDDPELPALNKNRDMEKYRTYMKNQLTELLTNYGPIDELWLDFVGRVGNDQSDYKSEEVIKLIRKLQPHVIVNNRLGLHKIYEDAQDFETPEQVNAEELKGFRGKLWETCQTFSGPWGYNRDDRESWKSNKTILDLLITSVANGGNLLFNVGPNARGAFDAQTISSLDSIGYWMNVNSRSIYGCTYAPDSYKVPEGTRLTYNSAAKKLYVHLFSYPSSGSITLPGYKSRVSYAQFLHDASELRVDKERSTGEDLVLKLPVKKPAYEIPVIELILK